jgi:flagellar protein FlaG
MTPVESAAAASQAAKIQEVTTRGTKPVDADERIKELAETLLPSTLQKLGEEEEKKPALSENSEEAQLAVTPRVEPELVRDTIKQMGNLQFGGRAIHFQYNDEIQRVVIRVESPDTEELVRQIPPEEYLDFVSRFRELFGLLLDAVA